MTAVRGNFTQVSIRLGRLLFFTAWSLATIAPLLYAQESVSMPPSKIELKNRAPVSREILRVKLPKPAEFKLKNGLTVLILEDQRAPYVNVQLYIGGAGALFEP